MDKIVDTDSDEDRSIEIANMKAMMRRAPLAFIEAAPDMSFDVVVIKMDN